MYYKILVHTASKDKDDKIFKHVHRIRLHPKLINKVLPSAYNFTNNVTKSLLFSNSMKVVNMYGNALQD